MKKQIYLNAVLLLLGASVFSEDALSLRLVNGQAEIRFQSLSNWQYAVEFSTNLMTWLPLKEGLFGIGDITCTNQTTGQQKCFYRMKRSDEFSVSFNSAWFSTGSEWTYAVSENYNGTVTDSTVVQRIDGYSCQNGYDVVDLGYYLNGSEWTGTDYILRDMSEGVFYVGYNDPTDGQTFNNPFEPVVYKRFVPGIQSPPLEIPPSPPDWGPATMLVTTFIEYGDVSVPAGVFRNTVKVEKRVSGTVYGSDCTFISVIWYARDVGPVRSFYSMSIPDFGYEDTESDELLSYKLK